MKTQNQSTLEQSKEIYVDQTQRKKVDDDLPYVPPIKEDFPYIEGPTHPNYDAFKPRRIVGPFKDGVFDKTRRSYLGKKALSLMGVFL